MRSVTQLLLGQALLLTEQLPLRALDFQSALLVAEVGKGGRRGP